MAPGATSLTTLGIIAMSTGGNGSGSGPFWDNNFENKVLGESNWTWQQPANPSDVLDELPAFVPGGKTYGKFEALGAHAWLRSSTKGPGVDMFSRFFRFLSTEAKVAMTHVEGHALGIMRRLGLKEGTLTINHPGGPCKEFCQNGIPELMEEGEKLWVRWGEDKMGYFTKEGWFPAK